MFVKLLNQLQFISQKKASQSAKTIGEKSNSWSCVL